MKKYEITKIEFSEDPKKNQKRIDDPRGEITQIMNDKDIILRNVVYIELKDGVIRGNHYHTKKDEYLYIAKGKVKVVLLDRETQEKKEIILQDGDLIRILPQLTHTFKALEYTQIIEFSPNVFDPEENECLPEKIME